MHGFQIGGPKMLRLQFVLGPLCQRGQEVDQPALPLRPHSGLVPVPREARMGWNGGFLSKHRRRRSVARPSLANRQHMRHRPVMPLRRCRPGERAPSQSEGQAVVLPYKAGEKVSGQAGVAGESGRLRKPMLRFSPINFFLAKATSAWTNTVREALSPEKYPTGWTCPLLVKNELKSWQMD